MKKVAREGIKTWTNTLINNYDVFTIPTPRQIKKKLDRIQWRSVRTTQRPMTTLIPLGSVYLLSVSVSALVSFSGSVNAPLRHDLIYDSDLRTQNYSY